MKVPHSEFAFIDENKLSGYCLNQFHPIGRHKARVFQRVEISDSAILKELLLEAVCSEEAVLERVNEYGIFYCVSFYYNRALIKSIWMIRKEETFPRLVTCYVA